MSLQEQQENETINGKSILNILVDGAMDYYEEIICHRAIPDNRDGLIECQRRILWTMFDKGWNSSKPHVKSARVVGEVMGRFHPHGDSSIYDTSTNMTQEWKNNFLLIDWHGNKGSISGKGPGAQRYTEQRSSKLAEKFILEGLKENSVDFIQNFSQDELEPVSLPAKIPFYLINGAFGLASGYMASVPTHNPVEVIEELIKRIKNPTYKINLLPDFPTGGTIINTESVRNTYHDFKNAIAKKDSKITIRAVIEKDEKRNKLNIVEIPYMKTLDGIMSSIRDASTAIKDKKTGKITQPTITGISNIKNLTSKGNTCISVYVKKGYDLDMIISQLYKFTFCQATLPIVFISVKGNNFIEYNNIDEVFDDFIEYRETTIKRIKMNTIRIKRLRMHILEGLLLILRDNDINEVIKRIRKQNSRKEVVEMLISVYKLDSIQAENVADYKLYQLSNFAIDKLEEELATKTSEVEEELLFFKDISKLRNYMIDEYTEMLSKVITKKHYPRRSKLENIEFKSNEEYLMSIPDTKYLILCTKKGFLKKIVIPKEQKRGGKGISIGKLSKDDFLIKTSILYNRDMIYIYTDDGIVYKYNVYDIPECITSNLGYNLSNNIKNQTVINMIPLTEEESKSKDIGVVIATRLNKTKVTSMSEFVSVHKNGIMYIKLRENDNVIGVEKVNYKKDDSVIALNSAGNAIRILLEDIPNTKRPTEGSNLFKGNIISDKTIIVTSIAVVNKDASYYFLITSKGLGKLMTKEEFLTQARGTMGKMVCKLRDKQYAVKLIPIESLEDNIVIVTNYSIVNVTANTISILKRPTYGNNVKKCSKQEEVVIDCVVNELS